MRYREPRHRPIEIRHVRERGFNGHSHCYLEMLIVINDGGMHIVDSHPFPLRRGEVHLLGPYNTHNGNPVADEVTDYYNIEFSPEVLCLTTLVTNDLSRQLILRKFFLPLPFAPLRVSDSVLQDIEMLCVLLERHIDEQSAHSDHYCSFLLTTLLYAIAPFIPAMEGNHAPLLFTVMDTINTRFKEDLTNLEVAQAVGLSQSRLSCIIKSTTGKTFKDLLNQRRLTEAKWMLTETTLTVVDVMLEAGFNDLSYFHRIFKEDTGLSPKEFRVKTSPLFQ